MNRYSKDAFYSMLYFKVHMAVLYTFIGFVITTLNNGQMCGQCFFRFK